MENKTYCVTAFHLNVFIYFMHILHRLSKVLFEGIRAQIKRLRGQEGREVNTHVRKVLNYVLYDGR